MSYTAYLAEYIPAAAAAATVAKQLATLGVG